MIKRIISYLVAAVMMFCTLGVLAADNRTTIRIEAESGAFTNLKYSGDAKYAACSASEPTVVQAAVDVPEGWYTVEFAATPGDGSSKWFSTYTLTIGGEEIQLPSPEPLTEKPGGAFNSTGKKFNTEIIYINGGENVIKFDVSGKTATNAFYLDYVSLIPAKAPTDKGIYQLEGENAFKFADGKNMETAHDDKTGRDFGSYGRNTIEEVSATFDVMTEGDYYFTFVATPGDGSNEYTSKYDVKINGEIVEVPASDSWDGCLGVGKLYNAGAVHLNRGTNTVSFEVKGLTANGTYLLYLDYVRFVIRKDYDFGSFFAADLSVYEGESKDAVIYDINDEIISTEYVDSIDYSSKDENIVYIDNGHICGKNVGKAEVEITVRREDDVWDSVVTVNVLNPDTGILFESVEETETGIRVTFTSERELPGVPVQIIAVARGAKGIENMYVESISNYVTGSPYVLDIPMQAGSEKTEVHAWCDVQGSARKLAAEAISFE